MESASRLSSEYIAVEFNGSEKKLLNTFESVETSYPGSEYIPVEARYLTSGELETNERKTYTIKLWMDESVTVEDDAMNKSFISKIVVTAKQSHKVRLVDYIMSETSKDFEKFEHPETYQTPALTDYRYTGPNPNNYVYFGCEENCTAENLYRIIGVIPTQSTVGGEYENRVKLIKNDYYTEQESGLLRKTNSNYPAKSGYGYQWNSSRNNKWEESTLNLNVLNGVYWKSLEDYQNYISTSVWYLGAPYWNHTVTGKDITPNSVYMKEHSNSSCKSGGTLLYLNKIGLMYLSDYAYSVGSSYIEEIINTNSDNYVSNAWVYELDGKYYEWTMTPENDYPNPSAWYILPDGSVRSEYAYDDSLRFWWGVRPTFYLKSDVLYKNGNGTRENPYRIGINA